MSHYINTIAQPYNHLHFVEKNLTIYVTICICVYCLLHASRIFCADLSHTYHNTIPLIYVTACIYSSYTENYTVPIISVIVDMKVISGKCSDIYGYMPS